jgi:hypothetical protein
MTAAQRGSGAVRMAGEVESRWCAVAAPLPRRPAVIFS